jgi:hypothetical protein
MTRGRRRLNRTGRAATAASPPVNQGSQAFGHKPRSLEQVTDVTARDMPDFPFHRCDADVVDKPPPETVAAPVEQKQPPARLEDAVHLRHGPILVRKMVETVGARHHIEGFVGKREPLAVPLDRHGLIAERLPALMPASQHAVYKIYPPNGGPMQRSRDAGREYTGTATHVEDRRRPVSELCPQPREDGPMRGTEQEPLENATIVAPASTTKLLGRLRLLVRHRVPLHPGHPRTFVYRHVMAFQHAHANRGNGSGDNTTACTRARTRPITYT